MPTTQTYFEILHLPTTATCDDVDAAYENMEESALVDEAQEGLLYEARINLYKELLSEEESVRAIYHEITLNEYKLNDSIEVLAPLYKKLISAVSHPIADLHFEFGELYQFDDDVKAIEQYNLCLALNPKHYEALLQKANSLAMEEHLAEAETLYKSLMDVDFGDYDAVVDFAEFLEDNGRLEEAFTLVEEAIQKEEHKGKSTWLELIVSHIERLLDNGLQKDIRPYLNMMAEEMKNIPAGKEWSFENECDDVADLLEKQNLSEWELEFRLLGTEKENYVNGLPE